MSKKYTISNYTRRRAREMGVTVKLSTRKGKKIDVYKNGKLVASVGATGYNDFPTYKRLERQGKIAKGTAEKRRKAFHNRFKSCRTNNCKYAKGLLW
ncbi:MAG: hypothetical protein AAGI23_09490 [Bacteroidota bacterium]